MTGFERICFVCVISGVRILISCPSRDLIINIRGNGAKNVLV